MAKKKKDRSKKKRKHLPSRSQSFSADMAEVDELLERGQWAEALPILQAQDRRHPNREDVLVPLAEVHYELGDYSSHLEVCERLHRLIPGSADITLMFAGAYLLNARPILALRTFGRYLERWPDHEKAVEVRRTVTEIEADVGRALAESGLTGDDAREVAALHEETLSLLEQGKYARARHTAEQLLKLRPQFAAALNNVGESWFREGRGDQAVACAERVLGFDPDNFNALSNLSRYLFLSGRPEEARRWTERLKAVQSSHEDVWTKKAEAFAVLGDDQAVLDALHGYEQAGKDAGPVHAALLHHLAAVAACRQGREDEARRLWAKALRLVPGFKLAAENLEDLDRPPGEGHAPWPYPLSHWLSLPIIEALTGHVERGQKRGKDAAVTREVRRFLDLHPAVAALVPPLLDRGDAMGREFAVRLAEMAETPPLLAALRDFALSQRGPDGLRLEAANAACRAGLIPEGRTRMWVRGEWGEMLLLGWELHGEPLIRHAPRVEQLTREAVAALQEAGDGDRAEALLRQALAQEPDAPDLLNNLASAYQAQGRTREAEDLIRQIHERHPDYLFARANMVQRHIRDGELDKARALLEPLMRRKRLHFSELAALCNVQMELALAEGGREAARTWFELWESADPEHPMLDHWRHRLREPGWLGRLFGRR